MSADPKGVARRHRRAKLFWIANIPLVAALYLWLPSKVMGLYIAAVSVYANYASEAAVEQGAESRFPDE